MFKVLRRKDIENICFFFRFNSFLSLDWGTFIMERNLGSFDFEVRIDVYNLNILQGVSLINEKN